MNKPKFALCATAIIKNEATYIEEWICYHRVLGVDHFFIFDNNSEDDIDRVLRPYINHGLVTLIRWPMLGGQIDAYNHAMHFFGQATEWMAYIDLDEFIVLKDSGTIPEFLTSLNGADQVLMPWRNFSFSGHEKRPAGLVIENYTLAQNIPPTGIPRINAKSIVRTAVAKRVTAHFSTTTTQATVDGLNRKAPEDYFLHTPSYERVQINHYYTKSYEEFDAKLGRGQVDGGAEKGKFGFTRPGYDTPDESALRYVEATRKQLELMRSLAANPFRYGSQLAQGGPQRRDPFSWVAKVAVSNYLADTPTLRLSTPVEFENFGKSGDMVARASDFSREPTRGAFRKSIHVSDMIRRLGSDIVFDLNADDAKPLAVSEGSATARGESMASNHAANSKSLIIPTERAADSRCYCLGFALRASGPLQLQAGPSVVGASNARPPVRSVEIPAAGYYCGILELSKDPVRTPDLRLTLDKAADKTEIFDLFAVAYG